MGDGKILMVFFCIKLFFKAKLCIQTSQKIKAGNQKRGIKREESKAGSQKQRKVMKKRKDADKYEKKQ